MYYLKKWTEGTVEGNTAEGLGNAEHNTRYTVCPEMQDN